MLIEHLQESLERGPARAQDIAAKTRTLEHEGAALKAYLEAFERLRFSWRDTDPGKYGPHWYAFRNGRKAWPRELVSVRDVDAHDEKRITRHPKLDPTPLEDFHRLDRQACPGCKIHDGIILGRYVQAEDGPHGDLWVKTRYVACAGCDALYELDTKSSDGRF